MSPAVSNGLGVLNPASGSKATDCFHHFNRLPPEVRQIIWGFELYHERLLHIEAHPQADEDDNEKPYKIILTEYQPISKLALVCSESRAVTHRFYRVQLTCLYRWEDRRDAKGIFYFNPELDTLEVRDYAFAKFAEDLWVHDPRRVGLLNVALSSDNNCVSSVNRRMEPTLQKVLSRLKRVVFLYRGGSERMFLGKRSTTESREKAEVYRSRPIMSAIPKFDRLQYDPRSTIETCLKSVYLDAVEPRRLIHRWLRLLHLQNVRHDHKVEYSFLVAFGGRRYSHSAKKGSFAVDRGWGPWEGGRRDGWGLLGGKYRPEITNRDSALGWVREKDKRCREALQEIHEKEKQDDIERRFQQLELPVQPAIGFWLFPIEALGPLPDATRPLPWDMSSIPNWESHRKIDLSGYQPQLCLSYLP